MVVSAVTEAFFKKHNMHFEDISFLEEVEKFKLEMELGLLGEKSSLMMLPAYIRVTENIPKNKPVIAIDAGGTNLRVAVVTLKEDGPLIEHFEKYPMPGSRGEVSKEEFYQTMADYIAPVTEYSDTVSFCFSFPCEIQSNQDGKVLYLTKEIYINGIEGSLLGEEINKELILRGLEKKKFLILNDTVAAMLSGSSQPDSDKYSGHAGLILGTGLNLCYGERCGNILKIANLNLCNNQRMVINIEAGGYDKFPRGTADNNLDRKTKDPGKYLFEKMASGAYLGKLIFQTVELAATENLFSADFSQRLSSFNSFELWDIHDFCNSPNGNGEISTLCQNESNRTCFLEILEMIYNRLAKFISISIAAILQKSEIGNSPANPAAIVAEGTTFYKSPIFLKYLDIYVKDILNSKLGIYCDFLQIEDATLLGTTVAGLTPYFSNES